MFSFYLFRFYLSILNVLNCQISCYIFPLKIHATGEVEKNVPLLVLPLFQVHLTNILYNFGCKWSIIMKKVCVFFVLLQEFWPRCRGVEAVPLWHEWPQPVADWYRDTAVRERWPWWAAGPELCTTTPRGQLSVMDHVEVWIFVLCKCVWLPEFTYFNDIIENFHGIPPLLL